MEKFTQVFLKEDDQRILPGKSFSFDFAYTPEAHKEHRIFFTGEVDNFYYWKSEYGCTPIYKRIDESLVPGTIGPWGLKFVGADYPIIACHKITWPPVLGYLTLTMVLDRAQINTVAVSSARRRQGLGRRLLEEGIRLCRAAKMSAMELEVRAGNLAALTLYRTLGFMEVGRRKGYYRDPPEDAVLMDLLL